MLGLPVREPRRAADFVARALDFGLIINAAAATRCASFRR